MKKRFKGKFHDQVAIPHVNKFEQVIGKTDFAGSKGVIYSKKDIQEYFATNGPFDQIVKRHGTITQPIPPGYEWGVAFYFTAVKEGRKNRIGFYVVPVLHKGSSVLEYFKDFDVDEPKRRYKHPKKSRTKKEPTCEDGDCNVYNEGHLWP